MLIPSTRRARLTAAQSFFWLLEGRSPHMRGDRPDCDGCRVRAHYPCRTIGRVRCAITRRSESCRLEAVVCER